MEHNISFKDYLINEDKNYFGEKIGDVLNGIQDTIDNYQGMGTRQVNKNSEQVVNRIRRILHTHWPQENEPHLKSLQKAGVAIMKSIEEKGDLQGMLQGSASELQNVMKDLGVPVNKLATPRDEQQPAGPPPGTGEPQGEKPPAEQPQDPGQQQPPPPGGDMGAAPPPGGDMGMGGPAAPDMGGMPPAGPPPGGAMPAF